MNTRDIEKEIYSTIAQITSNIGYSEIHGRIIGVLLVKGKALSLQELSDEMGYSISTVSPSLDLLEMLGMIKKIKHPGDRNLYVKLEGDLLVGLKKALLIKIQKNLGDSLEKFRMYKKELKHSKNGNKKEVLRTLNILEKEVKRMSRYVNILSKLRLP